VCTILCLNFPEFERRNLQFFLSRFFEQSDTAKIWLQMYTEDLNFNRKSYPICFSAFFSSYQTCRKNQEYLHVREQNYIFEWQQCLHLYSAQKRTESLLHYVDDIFLAAGPFFLSASQLQVRFQSHQLKRCVIFTKNLNLRTSLSSLYVCTTWKWTLVQEKISVIYLFTYYVKANSEMHVKSAEMLRNLT
jgi:hypothetical protein